jgi:glycosyltransferase involved in cell wall biosynthesis
MDMTILTSISEGQPLTILESYAAKKPVIATDVGNCRGLIYGEDDDFGEAGILTHIMNVKEIADAMVNLAANPALRKRMGENGYQRLMSKYTIEQMKDTYEQLYRQCAKDQGISYPTEPFRLPEEQQT